MVRKSGYFVAFVIAAFGSGAWFYWQNSVHRAGATSLERSVQVETKVISSEAPPAFGAGETGSSSVAKEGAAVELAGGANSKVGGASSMAHSAAGNLNSDSNSQSALSEMDGLTVPEGAPFPISESIETECASGEDLYFDCPGVKRALKRIEDERNDTHWAPSMERQIRAAVAAVTGLRIRALACRSSVCVVETDGAHVTQKTWIPIDMDLFTAGYIRAYERTGNGEERIRVQLWAFQRRTQ